MALSRTFGANIVQLFIFEWTIIRNIHRFALRPFLRHSVADEERRGPERFSRRIALNDATAKIQYY